MDKQVIIECWKETFVLHEQVLWSDTDSLQAIDNYYRNFNEVHLVWLSIDWKYLCQTKSHTWDNVFSYNNIYKMSILPPFKHWEEVWAGSDIHIATYNYEQWNKFHYLWKEKWKHIVWKLYKWQITLIRVDNVYELKRVVDNTNNPEYFRDERYH